MAAHLRSRTLIDVAGTRTGGGNPGWLAQQAPAVVSASVVEQALAAGATFVGKTVTDELAFSLEGRNVHYPDLINPICPDRLPGGSSSGSAVAVAAGQADFALGTDTGGSVRVPANFLASVRFPAEPRRARRSMASCRSRRPTTRSDGSRATPNCWRRSAPHCCRKPAPRRSPNFCSRATRLRWPTLRSRKSWKQAIANWTINGETIVFGGDQARYLDCYRILQGAEIWQSLGPWIARHRPRFAADIAERFAGTAPHNAGRGRAILRQFAPRSARVSRRWCRPIPRSLFRPRHASRCCAMRPQASSAIYIGGR